MVLEKILEIPLDYEENALVNSKGNQPWVFIERTVAETETSIRWTPDGKSQLTGEVPDTGKH